MVKHGSVSLMRLGLVLGTILLCSATGVFANEINLSDTMPYHYDFDMGIGVGVSLAGGWSIDFDAVDTAPNNYDVQGDSFDAVGGDNIGAAAAAGIYNLWDGADQNATDRAAGWLGNGTHIGGNLYAKFHNNSNRSMSGATISYSIEKYRNGDNDAGFTVRMYYSTDGTSWTLAGSDFTTNFPDDGNNNGFADAPGSTTRIDSKTVNVLIPSDGTLYLCWNYAVTSGATYTNAQCLGIDDFAIIAGGAMAEMVINEVRVDGSPDWFEFYVTKAGCIADTMVKNDGGDTVPFGSGQWAAEGDYIVLWMGAGSNDVVKGDNNAGFWDFYWGGSGGMTSTDDAYKLFMSGSLVMQDFIVWANQGATFPSDEQEAIIEAYLAGQWDTFGFTPDQSDCVRSMTTGVFARNENSDDTESHYGWERIAGTGTPGSVNPAFQNKQGEGYWGISPPGDVTAGAAGSWNFTYYKGATTWSDGYLRLTVPSGWTTPQVTNAGAAGFVWVLGAEEGEVEDNNLDAVAYAVVDDSAVIVGVNNYTDSITICYGYGGGAASATAPGAAGSYTFLLASDPIGSNVSYLDSSPVLTVVESLPLQVYLQNVASETMTPDSTNVTVLAGFVMGDTSGGGDSLTSFAVANLGDGDNGDTAYNGAAGGLNLWQDVNGDSVYDGGDSWVGTLNWSGTTWFINSATVDMPDGVFNFVVTVNIGSAPSNLRTFQMGINANELTSSSSARGPVSDTYNADTQTIWIFPAEVGDVIITELMWDAGTATEWFELYNTTDRVINMLNWTVSDGEDTHWMPDVNISPGQYFLCEREEGAVPGVAADDIYGVDGASIDFTTGGDQLFITSAETITIDMMDFGSNWPAGDDAAGIGGCVSMERRNLDSAISAETGANWLDGPYTAACGAVGGVSGTPGKYNSCAYYDYVKINEVNFNDWGSPENDEWIEIYNAGDTPVNVYNWQIGDMDGNDKLLPQVAIPAKGSIVYHYSSGNDDTVTNGVNSVLHLYEGSQQCLANTGDEVALFTSATEDTYALIDFVAYAVTPGSTLGDEFWAVSAGQWPSVTTQVDVVDANGRSIFRVTDGADSNTTDTGDWTQLSNTEVNMFSEGGTNMSNYDGALTGVTGLTVIATNTDFTGYRGSLGDSALIEITATDNDPACTNTTNCTVWSSITDPSGEVVLKLTETGLNTGIFRGYLQLRSSTRDGEAWIAIATGDVVTINSVENSAYYDTIVIGAPTGLYGVVINEYLANAICEPGCEYIELYNTTDTDQYIAGCWLDDISGGGSASYQIPVAGTAMDTIPAHGFRTFYGDTTGITLNNGGDDVRFLDADNATVIDAWSYIASTDSIPMSRVDDGWTTWAEMDPATSPGMTPGNTNNPQPAITACTVSSSVSDSFYSEGEMDTSVYMTTEAGTVWFSSASVAQTVTITVGGTFTWADALCTGTSGFGDASPSAGEDTMPYTVTYSIEQGLGSQDLTIYLTDEVNPDKGDSITIHFQEDHTPPQIDFISHPDLSDASVGSFYDTEGITDTEVGYQRNYGADTPEVRYRWTPTGDWGAWTAMDSSSQYNSAEFYYVGDTTNDWAAHAGETLYWQVRARDMVGNWTYTTIGQFEAQEYIAYNGPWYVNDWFTTGDGYTSAIGLDTNPGKPSAPFGSIWKALDVASAGDTIYVDAGIYSESVVVGLDNLWIIGYDSHTVRIDPPVDEDGIQIGSADFVTLRNLGIADAVRGIELTGADTCTVASCSVAVSSAEAIYLDNCNYTVLYDNTVDSTLGDGIELQTGDYNTFDSNTVANSIEEGIDIGAGNCTATGNVVYGGGGGYAIYVHGATVVYVENNTVSGNADDGIHVSGSSNSVDVIGNSVRNNFNDGIDLEGGANGVYVYNNVVDSNADDGFYVDGVSNCFIDSNIISRNLSEGIYFISSDSNYVGNCSIADNGSVGDQQGIEVNNSDTNVIENTIVDHQPGYNLYILGASYNNIVRGCTITNGVDYGVYIDCDTNAVVNSYIYSNNDEGIYLGGGVDTCYIYNNTIDSNGNAGIRINGSQNIADSNTITRSGCELGANGYGIYVTTDSNVVSNNYCNGNRSHGIYLNGADTNMVFGNTLMNGQVSAAGVYLTNARGNYVHDNLIDSNIYHQVYLTGATDNNTIDSNTITRGLGTRAAISLDGVTDNTLSNNLAEAGYDGLVNWDGDNNLLISNVFKNQSNCGMYLGGNADNNSIISCTSTNNQYGCYMEAATGNDFWNNVLQNNLLDGICMDGSDYNGFYQNRIDSNAEYQVHILGAAVGDTLNKNNFITSPANPTWAVNVVPVSGFDFERNYWNTTDTTLIYSYISGGGKADVWFSPFRLGRVDTGVGADSVAPNAPDTVAAASQSETCAIVTWRPSSGSEEQEAAANVNGYRIYRSQYQDTNWWYFVSSMPAAAESFNDSGLTQGVGYYYRVTTFDNHSPWDNESFYSDSIASCTPASANATPHVTIYTPVDGDTYGGDLSCSFVISDSNSDLCRVCIEVSIDSGLNWFVPTTTGLLITLSSDPVGDTHRVTWHTTADYLDENCTFIMRISVADGVDTGTGDTTYHFGIDNKPPAAPTNLVAYADTPTQGTAVHLTWDHVVEYDTKGYHVYVDTDADGNWERLTSSPLTDTNGFRYTGVTEAETYVFAVTCVDQVDTDSGYSESEHSDTATAPLFIVDKYAASCLLAGVPSVPIPGATLTWHVRAANRGFGPGDSIVITDTVDINTSYKANSADTIDYGYSAVITYSHDSGATWDDSQAAPVTNIKWAIYPEIYTDSIIEVKYEAYID